MTDEVKSRMIAISKLDLDNHLKILNNLHGYSALQVAFRGQ